jgi:hypothetical protein
LAKVIRKASAALASGYQQLQAVLPGCKVVNVDEPGHIEPTNNAMEQRFRFVVIDRKITQGTRGETGRRWCERIWTVLATCAQQRRSAFEFLSYSIIAYLKSQASPCLLPLPP